MTDRFDEATRLKNLLGRKEAIIDREKDTRTVNHGLVERMGIERDIGNAAPWLLEVAGCFQPGDGNLIYELISAMDAYFGGYYGPHKAAMQIRPEIKWPEEKE